MANGKVSWEEWQGLTEDQREYSLYMTLKDLHECHSDVVLRVGKLEKRRWLNTAFQFAGSVLGGAAMLLAYIKIAEPLIKATGG